MEMSYRVRIKVKVKSRRRMNVAAEGRIKLELWYLEVIDGRKLKNVKSE